MSLLERRLAVIAGVFLSCLALPALSHAKTVMVSTPNSNKVAFGPYSWYNATDKSDNSVGPYQVSVNGGKLQDFVCDDYEGTINKGQTWSATLVKATSITASNINSLGLAFASTIGIEGYAEVAQLVEHMLNATPGNAIYSALSSAIWYITSNGNSLVPVNNSPDVDWKYLSGAAQAYVTTVQAEFAGAPMASQTALSKDYGLDILGNTNKSYAQEGFINVAEGGAAFLYLLLAFVSCFGALVLSGRERSRMGEAI
ncbi:MAG: hypothetical protein ACRD3N_12965 [Terracidiphilus sp.]